MKKQKSVLLVAAIAAVLASSDLFATAYTTLDDPMGVSGTEAYGISGGTVVGTYLNAVSVPLGFIYNGSTFTTLNDPLGVSGTEAYGISGSTVVGTYLNAVSVPLGFIYNGSTYTTLNDPMGVSGTEAYGISGGTVVGAYLNAVNVPLGFVYNGSTYTTLNDPMGVSGTEAYGISGGTVVGTYFDAVSVPHGFIYNGSTYTTLNDPLGVSGTEVYGISGSDVVGVYLDAVGVPHGFIYNGSTYTTLDDPMGVSGTEAYGISGGTIVGTWLDAVSVPHGFIVSVPSGSAIWSAASGNYSNSLNWTPASGSTAVIPNGAGQIATFGSSTSPNVLVTIDGSYTVGQLAFNSATTTYALSSGGSITMDNQGAGGGASVIVSSGTLSPSIETTLTLADSSKTTTFNIAGNASLEVAGAIGESATYPGQQIVLAGGGSLQFDNNNAYTGGTTIVNGMLVAGPNGDNQYLTFGTGPLTFNPGMGQTATLAVNNPLTINNLSETPGAAGAAQINVAGSTALTVNQSVSGSYGGTINVGTAGSLTINVNAGTLALTGSTAPTISGTVSVTVAAGATLRLAGSAPALSNSNGSNAANITTNGTDSSGDGTVLVTGATTQTVGVISGPATTNSGATTYAGNTTVGDGTHAANLTATQILQNTLTIGAGSTVTIAPSGSGIPTDEAAAAATDSMATSDSTADGDSSSNPFTVIEAAIASGSIGSAKGQQLENRIAAIERLAATDPGLDVSLLEDRVLGALPSASVWSSSGTSPLSDSGAGLLAVDGDAIGSSYGSSLGGSPAFAPAADFGGSPAAVPEPSTLLLAALGSIGVLFAVRRRTI